MVDSIKITALQDIGANIAYTTLVPLVNMAGTPTTQKSNLQNLGNLILNGAGGSYFPRAAQANLALSVANAAQPNITSVGTLTSLAVTGNITAGNINGGNIVVANFYYGDGRFLTNVVANSSYSNSNVANYLPTFTGNVGAGNVNVTGTVYANGLSSTGLASLTTLTVSATSNLGAVGNVTITGGSAGQKLTTNGNGVLSWTNDANSSYGDSNVVSLLSAFGSNTITTTGNISGGNLVTGGQVVANGNVSSGTGLTTGGFLSVDGTADLHNTTVTGYANVNGTANTVGGGATVGVRSILAIDSAFGSNNANDPASAQAVRGRVTGNNLTKTRNYVAGVTGQYLVTGTNASEFINTGLLGVVGDQTTTANAAVVAYLDGDGGLTTAGSAYGVSMKNSTPGSGFDYGLDLQFIDLNVAGTTTPFKQADIRFNNGVELVANTANNISINANVTVGNITANNLGNISSINIDGSNSNVLYGNGVFAAVAGGANTGNVTFNDINIIGTGNLKLQPDSANANAYLDIYLTGGPDIHIAGNGETVILGTDDFANVAVNVDGNVSIQAGDANGTHTWTFGNDGKLTFPGTPRIDTDANNFEVQAAEAINFEANTVVNIYTDAGNNAYQWQFGDDGSLTLPIGVSIDYNGNVQYPKIIADSGKLFSVQGQGNTGSAALAWTVDPNAATQYAAVAVTRAGGDDLAKVVLTAQANSGDSANAKIWTFNETGNLTLPGNTFAVNYANGTQVSIGGGSGNTGNVTFDDNIVIGTGDEFGGDGLFLAPGNGSIANGAVQYLRVRGGDYPTHIHLDTGNNQYYDQYFGADGRYVKLEANGNVVINADDYLGNSATWTLTTDGNLILADGNSVIQSIANSSLDILNPNVSTMVLTPDPGYGSQALVLDPTLPGHIHLRAYAFSNIDAPSANLFLGGEDTAFEITEGANNQAVIHSNGKAWTFGNDGNISSDTLTFTTTFANVKTVEYQTAGVWDLYVEDGITGSNTASSRLNVSFKDNLIDQPQVYIENTKESDGIALRWTFDENGNLNFPRDVAGNTDPYLNIFGGSTPTIQSTDVSLAGPANLAIQSDYLNLSGSTGNRIAIYADNGEIGTEANMVLYTNLADPGNIVSWTLDTTGNLTLPDTTSVIANVSITLEANDSGNITGLSVIGDANANLYAHGNVTIVSDSSNTTATWAFGNNGILTLPGGSQISETANTSVNITANANTWAFGVDGNLTVPGSLVNDTSIVLAAPSIFNICTIATAGSGYNTGSSLKATTGGSGSGMTVGIGYGLSNQLTSVSVVNPGTGYVNGDVITVSEGTGGTFVISKYNQSANQTNNNTIQTDFTFANSTVTLPIYGEMATDYSMTLTTNLANAGNTSSWTFGTDGNLTVPGNLVIAGNTSVFGTNASLLQTTDNLPLIALSSGANGAVSSIWVEDVANVGTSNIAAVYANPTVGSGIVRIAVGQNGGGGPNLWDFGATGNLTLPGNTFAVNYANGTQVSLGGGNVTWAQLEDKDGNSGPTLIALGQNAGLDGQGNAAIAIGLNAGQGGQGEAAITIGQDAGGNTTQGANAVAIGRSAGFDAQGEYSVAIGQNAGSNIQGLQSVAVGLNAGSNTQGNLAVAIGVSAGFTNQGDATVAIGPNAGHDTQSNEAVAIGAFAGNTSQGTSAVAIGSGAGRTSQGNNSIILNATGANLNQTTANTFTVAPVRNDVANIAEVMFYNNTSKEVTYGNTISVAGNIAGNNISATGNISGGNLVLTTGNIIYTPRYGSFYSNATQTNPVANTAMAMTFNNTNSANGVSVVSNSRLTVAKAGVYNIQFSAQFTKTDAGTDYMEVWLSKNGTSVPWTNTRLRLVGSNVYEVASWNFVETLGATEYVQLMWGSADLNAQIVAIPSANTTMGIDVPSVIVTVTPVGA
jgi:hypothetical protein